MINQSYLNQADLLLQVIPHIAQETNLALKGGTAINLFLRNMPRLSVDIDLTYLPFDNRETALTNISDSLGRIRERITKSIPGITVNNHTIEGNDIKLLVQSQNAQIKVEVNTITRGHLHPVRLLQVNEKVQERFQKFAAIQVVSDAELFGGKICAALDRQHPRDLFDVFLLFQESGYNENVKYGFIQALVSHMRTMHEVLHPHLLDQRTAFDNQFQGMSDIDFTYEDFENTREKLIETVNSSLTDTDRSFLLSFKRGEPDWNLFPVKGLKDMSAVQWKLLNLQNLIKSNPGKHKELLSRLETLLSNES
ncbi:MAG: nucleotidyl transferase AbiEii/AbiGii toxin family protein [Bacteroidales bacterium]|nr:nucleotidyl transferase AbiEii/AbiGii toxin family protein [Bacteroidales bacterium]